MIFIFGRRLSGKVDVSAGTCVLTEFAHAYYLPIFPTRSILAVGRTKNGAYQSLPIRLHGLSVFAAYARTWGALLAFWSILTALQKRHEGLLDALPWAVCALGLGVAVALSWTTVGKLSVAELARRAVYARLSGYAVDVALLGTSADALLTRLRGEVAEQGRGLMSGTYRSARDPATQWSEIALDPLVDDRSYLETCLTLARLEWARTSGPDRARMAGAHRAIWRKIASSEKPAALPALAGDPSRLDSEA